MNQNPLVLLPFIALCLVAVSLLSYGFHARRNHQDGGDLRVRQYEAFPSTSGAYEQQLAQLQHDLRMLARTQEHFAEELLRIGNVLQNLQVQQEHRERSAGD
jgi:hypothetical protein